MYRVGETEIQMARRQVLAAEEMVARQRGIVERCSMTGEMAEISRAYLAELEDSLAEHRAELARLLGPSCPPPVFSPEQAPQGPTIR